MFLEIHLAKIFTKKRKKIAYKLFVYKINLLKSFDISAQITILDRDKHLTFNILAMFNVSIFSILDRLLISVDIL